MEKNLYHSEPMAYFLQIARYIVAGILILLSSWVFMTNIFSDFLMDGEGGAIHYLYTFVGYGMALLVFMMTPAGLVERGD
ncbi:MAG: hypothetical protein HN541_06590 [Euryarchaeota archaeon]|jgi:hypothetical protein|nr:hypothetical protein [Euryarchaeota archaeon]MBT5281550.1 hypothetical protein [Euryarchaeota archaeon]MBT5593249.1 hypothetical protein [Euryarchaeota archaeon]